MSDEPVGVEVEMSVDELARAAGTLSSTVRLYQNRGLLPPPRRVGRRAVYDGHHLQRLTVIAQLQDRGHSLAGIRELIDGWDSRKALPDVLGVGAWSSPQPLRLTLRELAERFAGVDLRPEDLLRAAEVELIAFDGSDIVVADPRFVDVGPELVALGLPVGVLLDEWDALSGLTATIARRFADVFIEYLWDADAAPSPDDLARLTAVLDRLGALARQVTDMALETSLRAQADVTAQQITGATRP